MTHVSVPLLFLPFPLELSSRLLLLDQNGHQQEDPLHILQNLNVIRSILNPGELVLIKQRHRSTIIYVVTARRTLGLLLVCSRNRFILISQMQSNYFLPLPCILPSLMNKTPAYLNPTD